MKCFAFLLLIFVSVCLPISAQMDSLSKQITSPGEEIHNADFYYNKGVDYFASGNSGYANLYFLKALRLDTAHKHARANLDLAIRMSPDNKLYPERLFLVRALFQILDFLSVNRLALLSLVLLFLSALSFVWLLFYDPDKERALPILCFALLCLFCVSSFILLGMKSYKQKHNQLAVLIASSAQLLPLSDTGSDPVADIHAGLIVTILESKDEFVLVRLPNGQTGRLPASTIAKVQ
jgi:tetratricopeptide (TPR) repeat protein